MFDLGFLGGGQLARMSIMAAQRMGLRCRSLDSGEDTPASQVAEARVGKLDDPEAIADILRTCRFVTLENEFIPAEAIRQALELADVPVERLLPSPDALATIQDKLRQREAYARAGVPSPYAVPLEGDGQAAVATLGFPMVLKARFGGYDGRGTRTARSRAEFEGYRDLWGGGGWLAEAFVPFRRELAVMAYLSADGMTRGTFPTMETVQKNHVCSLVFPCDVDAALIGLAAVEAVGGRGLFGVELFELEDGSLQVNEIAPRPHNTGHYTLDWGGISQFEVHARLAMRLPVPTPVGGPACMANLLGQSGAGDWRRGLEAALAEDPDARVHWYGKAESKPGRKMGHLNCVGEECRERAIAARAAFYRAWTDS